MLLATTTMNTYPESLTTSMENSRNGLRRIARHDDKEFSHQSILNVMETFVKTVNTMDETILVPCRLMDLKVGDENDPTNGPTVIESKKNKKKETVQDLLQAADLFDVYNMLNNVKDGLLWGGEKTQYDDGDEQTVTATGPSTNGSAKKGHIRRPSTVSVASTNSTSTISDSESDAGSTNENDSGIEENSQDLTAEKTQKVASDFCRHLHGLTRSLKQMTETAHYLTRRYQHDIGGPV